MALQTLSGLKPNPLSEFARQQFHRWLDEALDRYDAGHPLPLSAHCGFVDSMTNVNCDIYLKDGRA